MKKYEWVFLFLFIISGTMFVLSAEARRLKEEAFNPDNNGMIVKKWENYRLHFTDGETSEMSCYVADLFENGTQFFCSDDDYEFTNIYGNIVKVEIVEK